MKNAFALLFIIFSFFQLQAQETLTDSPSPIIFIYDASGSMWGQIEGNTKMEIATNVLTNAVNNLPDTQHLGLVAYGHRKEGDCRDVEFLVDIDNGSKSAINSSLKGIKPLGKTPLAYSAELVINKLKNSKTSATVIIITDGIESCDGDICKVVTTAKAEGIDFRLHIIGFGLKKGETEQLECAAQAGDGQYFDADNANDLGAVLDQATNISVDLPAYNFTGFATKNGEAVDAYYKAKNKNGDLHQIAARSYQDTASMYLPPGTYDIEVSALENSDVDIVLLENIITSNDSIVHKNTSFDAGKVLVTIYNNKEPWDATVNLYKHGSKKSASGTRTYGKTKILEVSPGNYDIEIGAMVIKGLQKTYRQENLMLKPGEDFVIDHNFNSGMVKIGIKDENGLIDGTININEINSNKNVANGRSYTSPSNNPKEFILTPGEYQVTVMPVSGEYKGQKESFNIKVVAGKSEEHIKTY